MKGFLLLLLSLSVVLASYNNQVVHTEEEFKNYILQQESFNIIDEILKLIEKFIQSIKDKINSLLKKVQEELAKIYAGIIAIVEKFKSRLNFVTSKAEIVIQTLKDKGGVYKECAEKNEIELNEVKNKTNERFDQCSDKYVQALKNYEENIRKNITKIEEQIDQLRLAIVTCIHLNPFKTAKCLLDRLSEYRHRIEDILSRVEYAVKVVIVEGTAAIIGIQDCTQSAINDAIVEIDEIQNNLAGCFSLTTTTSTTSTTTTTGATTPTKNPDTN